MQQKKHIEDLNEAYDDLNQSEGAQDVEEVQLLKKKYLLKGKEKE